MNIEIGSSEAPVILGVSPHETPWGLWAKKVGLITPEQAESEAMAWGTRLQGEVLHAFAEQEHMVIYEEQKTHRHFMRTWQRATPDGFCMRYRAQHDDDSGVLVEIKCVVHQVPPVPRVDWIVQCLHQRLTVPNVNEQQLVAFGGLRMISWEIPWHQRAMDRVLREEEKFLELVEKQIPPPVKAEDAGVLNRAWPWPKPRAIALPAELLGCDAVLVEADRQIKAWKDMQAGAEAQIKTALGEAEQGILPNGTRYSWKAHDRKEYTVKANRIRSFKRVGSDEP